MAADAHRCEVLGLEDDLNKLEATEQVNPRQVFCYTRLVRVALLLALCGAPVVAPASAIAAGPSLSAIAVRLPEPRELARAAKSKDDAELERVASRLGAVRVARVAIGGKRDERLAALRALPLLPDGWSQLEALARLAGDPDAEVATAAAEAARRIAEGLTPDVLEREEVPRDAPGRAAEALLALARKESVPVDARVALIAAAAALRGVARVDEAPLVKLAADKEPLVRRAALEAIAGGAGSDALLEQAVASDPSVDVAGAAAAALCRDVASSALVEAPKQKPGRPAPAPSEAKLAAMAPGAAARAAAEARAQRMGAPARERLRKLALDENVQLADRLDLLGCLRVAQQPADRAVLDELSQSKRVNEALRRRARSLGGR
jgi:hypothetical protein